MPSARPHAEPAPARQVQPDGLCQRILAGGCNALPDEEVLEFLLRGVSRRQARRLAQQLLARFGSFPRAIAAPLWELLSVEGLGASGAALLKCTEWAALRMVRAEVINKPVLDGWDRLLAYLHAELSRERQEQLRILFLNARSRLLADELLAWGTVDRVRAYPREVARRALQLSATAIILVQNKTSGSALPSIDDIALSARIGRAAAVLSIRLVDHLVVGDGSVFSFRKEGLLGQPVASADAAVEREVPLLGTVSDP